MAYNFSSVRVLVVDDMQPMLALTASLMKMFGFGQVDSAKTAEEGFNLFALHNHDIVITDWLMEPKDGIDLIKKIRHSHKSPNKFVPIILMTGYSDRPRVEIARDTGVTEFLMKPYTARDMYARIVQIIEKPRQYVDAGEFFGPDRRRRKEDAHERKYLRRKNDGDARDGTDAEEISSLLRDLRNETSKL